MFYGIKYYNDLILEAGDKGFVQSEVLLQKDKKIFTLKQRWAFPRRVYFNGDECMLPPPDSYPSLPDSTHRQPTSVIMITSYVIFALFFICLLLVSYPCIHRGRAADRVWRAFMHL